mmetsp:Transcript_115263/g.336982  ORF Transcript_115263/g.336982 Transcript_115263/m.336982 type:complete len:208 (-) Transcript_115263:6-629(-)
MDATSTGARPGARRRSGRPWPLATSTPKALSASCAGPLPSSRSGPSACAQRPTKSAERRMRRKGAWRTASAGCARRHCSSTGRWRRAMRPWPSARAPSAASSSPGSSAWRRRRARAPCCGSRRCAGSPGSARCGARTSPALFARCSRSASSSRGRRSRRAWPRRASGLGLGSATQRPGRPQGAGPCARAEGKFEGGRPRGAISALTS